MSKLGDLFVRLGLKKQDFDKGINDAQKELKGFEAASGRMASVAAAAWAAVALALFKNLYKYTLRDFKKFFLAVAQSLHESLVAQLIFVCLRLFLCHSF